jgi:hyperosmotically inducible periplasmic protein
VALIYIYLAFGRRLASSAFMYFAKITQSTFIAVSLMLGTSSIGALEAQSTDAKTKPDNSAVNKRDQNPDQATADKQKMNPTDRDLTAKIRKAVVADKSLSTYAHNVKIISQDGTVTLKGPVRSDDEVKSIVAKATEVTGSADKVINQLSVQPASK